MNYLNNDNFNNFNITGLKEICRYNRDIFINYNQLARDELLSYMINKINDDEKILLPSFIYNDNKYRRKYNIKAHKLYKN